MQSNPDSQNQSSDSKLSGDRSTLPTFRNLSKDGELPFGVLVDKDAKPVFNSQHDSLKVLNTDTGLDRSRFVDKEQKSASQDSEQTTSSKSKAGSIIGKFFDTEGLFAIGDFALALVAAQFLGIAANALVVGATVAGKSYEVYKNKKSPIGVGFVSMAAVSAVTCASILINSFAQHGSEFLNLTQEKPLELFLWANAFAAWTIANCLACRTSTTNLTHETIDRGIKQLWSKFRNKLENKQVWFCAGSLFATAGPIFNNPSIYTYSVAAISASLLATGLMQALRGNNNNKPIQSLRGFLSKHMTPSRLRFLAFGISALLASMNSPAYVLPYLLFMAGNLRFDSTEINQSFLSDLKKALKSKKLAS
jgi:cytochrome bd-type quinol oxidase subunit 2